MLQSNIEKIKSYKCDTYKVLYITGTELYVYFNMQTEIFSPEGRLLAVPFQSIKRVSWSRKQARRDWNERTSGGETGGEAPLPQGPSVRITFAHTLAARIADLLFALPLDYPERDC